MLFILKEVSGNEKCIAILYKEKKKGRKETPKVEKGVLQVIRAL